MTKIEFHAKSMEDCKLTPEFTVKKGSWVLGAPVFWDDACYLVSGSIHPDKGAFVPEFCARVDPETLAKSTGMRDRDGREIYEGDILCKRRKKYRVISAAAYPDKHFYQLTLYTPKGCFMHCKFKDRNTRFEVVGNVFDNPELLEKEAEG